MQQASFGVLDGTLQSLGFYFINAGGDTGFYRDPATDTLVFVVNGSAVAKIDSGGFGALSKLIIKRSTVAATGTDNTNAALLSTGFNSVTAADDTVGVILPVMVAGEVVIVKSTVASKILKVYPFAGAAINSLTATTQALSLASGKLIAMFICDSATQVFSLPLLPS